MSEVKMSIDEKNTNNLNLEKDNYIKQEKIKEEKIKQINKIKEESVHMICRQSELSYEEAKIELEKYNYNYMDVLNNYHNINNKKNEKNEKNKSINQTIYSEIRDFMDTGSKTVRTNNE